MATKTEIKYYAGLHDRKLRQDTGLFMVEGHKVIGEGLKSACACEALFARKGFVPKDPGAQEIFDRHRPVVLETDDFDRLARTAEPQGLLGVFDWRPLVVDEVEADQVVVLFDVADPRNVGTIIRCGDWFGLRAFLVGETCVDLFNEKVVRSTTGSIFHCRFQLARKLTDDLSALRRTHRVCTADLGGLDYRTLPRAERNAWVFSNEARGPSKAILARTDQVITIPGGGRAESLSVASAAAIIMAGVAG